MVLMRLETLGKGQIGLTNSVAGVNLIIVRTGNFRAALGFWDFPEALRISG
jgi:hypothetical protein